MRSLEGPLVGLAGIRVYCVGDELLTLPEHFDWVQRDLAERLQSAVQVQRLRRLADTDQVRLAELLLEDVTDFDGYLLVEHIDIDRNHFTR